MRMTHYSNYAIRVLMYAGLNRSGPCAVPEIARAFGISYDHLKKAAAELCRLGYLRPVRGRGGGVILCKPAEEIRIGDVIRHTEGNVQLVECFNPDTNTCPLIASCILRVALSKALDAFFSVLDRYTLADLLQQPHGLAPLLGIELPSVECERVTAPSALPVE